MKKLELTLEELKQYELLSNIARSSIISLTAEMAEDNNPTVIGLVKENMTALAHSFAIVKEINTQIGEAIGVPATVTSDAEQKKLLDESGKAIDSGYTKAEEPKKEVTKAANLTVVKSGPEKKVEAPVVKKEETKAEPAKKAEKTVDTPVATVTIERLESDKAAKTVIFDNIMVYAKTNSLNLKKDKLPNDVRALLCTKLKALSPLKDGKFHNANDGTLKSTLGNITAEVMHAIAKEKMTNGNSVAKEDKVTDALAAELKKDQLKQEEEKKETPAEEKPKVEEPKKEDDKPVVEPKKEEPAAPVVPTEPIVEPKTEEKKEEDETVDQAHDMAAMIEEQTDIIRKSDDKKQISTTMTDIFTIQENVEERQLTAKAFSKILIEKKKVYADAEEVYAIIQAAAIEAKELREKTPAPKLAVV